MTRTWRIALLVAATALSFGAFFAAARATDSGNTATAPRPPAVPPALTGDASLGHAAGLPALRPAPKKPRRAAPAPAPAPAAKTPEPSAPAASTPSPTPVTPIAPTPAPRAAPRPAPKPAPAEDFDDSG